MPSNDSEAWSTVTRWQRQVVVTNGLWNTLALGVGFFLLFTAFNTTQTFETSLSADLGRISLVIIYTAFPLSNLLVSSSFVQLVGPRLSLVLAAVTYVLFVLVHLFAVVWLRLLSALLLGLGAAVLWTAHGVTLTYSSTEQTIGRHTGIFFTTFQASGLVGNLLAAATFAIQGAGDAGRNTLFVMLTIIGSLSCVWMWFTILPLDSEAQQLEQQLIDSEQQIVDSEQQVVDSEQQIVDSEQQIIDSEQQIIDSEHHRIRSEQQIIDSEQQLVDNEHHTIRSEQQIIGRNNGVSTLALIGQQIKLVVMLFVDRSMLLASPYLIWLGFMTQYYNGSFTSLIAADRLGFVMSCYALANLLTSALMGSTIDRLRLPHRYLYGLVAFCLQAAAIVFVSLTAAPLPVWLGVVAAAMLGLAEGLLRIAMFSLLRKICAAADSSAVFSYSYLLQSLATSAAFTLSIFFSFELMTMIFVLTAFAGACFLFVSFRQLAQADQHQTI